jgi:hypothetical protein
MTKDQMEKLADEIRRTLVDPRSVAERFGLSFDGSQHQASGISLRCFMHADKGPSLSITMGPDGTLRVKCHAGCFQGSVLDLIAAKHGLSCKGDDFGKVLRIGAELAGIRIDEAGGSTPRASAPPLRGAAPAAPPPPKPLDATWDALPQLDADAWEYLRSRGIDGAADLCRTPVPASPGGLGKFATMGLRLACALRNAQGTVTGIQVRAITGEKNFRVEGQSSAGVFGDPRLIPSVASVVVAEGLSDFLAASAVLAGRSNVTVIGVAGVENAAHLEQLPLKGKRVVLAMDADPAGDKAAGALAAKLQRLGARICRARPGLGCKDLCDLVKAGQNLADFLAKAPPLRTERPHVVEVTLAQDLKDERAERLAERTHALTYGVEFLDRLFGGIFPNDNVLVGAKTGAGKTELLTTIAAANAELGHRVRYFALEAERREITRRLKYRELMHRGYSEAMKKGVVPSYLDWRQADAELDAAVAMLEPQVERDLVERYGGDRLVMLYRMGGFSVDDFVSIAEETVDQTDLYILDHLHYIEMPDDNENRGLTKILQAISDLSLRLNRPIVMAAHLRKEQQAQKGNERLIPSLDDFQGTSNLSKISTKILMVGPAKKEKASSYWLSPTFMQAQKLRRDGSRCAWVGCVEFNHRTGGYENAFRLGKVKGGKFEAEVMDEWPFWATRDYAKPKKRAA